MPRGHRPQNRYISVRWTREQLAARRAFSIILFIFQHAQAEPGEYRQGETLKLAPSEKASKLWDIALQTPRTVHGNFAQTNPDIRLFPRNLCLPVIYRITIDSRTLGELFDCFPSKKREKSLYRIVWRMIINKISSFFTMAKKFSLSLIFHRRIFYLLLFKHLLKYHSYSKLRILWWIRENFFQHFLKFKTIKSRVKGNKKLCKLHWCKMILPRIIILSVLL